MRDYVKKGSQILIEGKIQTRSWDEKTSGEKKYKTEILCNELILLVPRSGIAPRTAAAVGKGAQAIGRGLYGTRLPPAPGLIPTGSPTLFPFHHETALIQQNTR